MIHIVEINEHNHAHAWFAFDEEDFVRKVRADHAQRLAKIIYQQTTARQLLTACGQNKHPQLLALATQHGLDTALYRADYLLGAEHYQTEAISELRACLAAVASAHDFRIYTDDSTAADELESDPLFRTKQGFDAGRKLRAQLIEMEVLADDM